MSYSCPSNLLRISVLALVAGVSLSVTGCAVTKTSEPTSFSTAAVQGKVMGGETPISGANVILWQTDPLNGGYGSSGAVKLATSTTTSGGSFNFTTGYQCAAGQFVYMTATGGDVSNGNNMTNNNEVQLAALGSCSNFSNAAAQARVKIIINEVSTVAAAYALSNFITVVPSTTGNQLVYIGAPANNNAATGACIGTGSSMTCVAAGLSHAFSNAIGLTDSVRYDGSFPGGTALTTLPGNALASVPQAEIHTLANVLQYCTNSTGGSAPAGVSDGSACGNLFAAAAPSTSSVPSDELSAIIDIAKNPKHNVSSTTCGTPPSTIFCFAPPSGAAFQPQLAVAPSDWSLAITYSGLTVGSASTSFVFPAYVTLDANDDVFVLASNMATANTTASVVAMSSNGIGLWANAQSAQFCYVGTLATDTVNNVWMANGPTTAEEVGGCWPGITSFNTGTGAQTNAFSPSTVTDGSPADPTHAIQSSSTDVAIDSLNDVWYARKTSSCTTCLFEFPYVSGTPATYGSASTGYDQTGVLNNLQMVFDSSNNLYLSNAASSGTTGLAYFLKNTGTASAPAYAAAAPAALTVPAVGTGLSALDAKFNLWVGQKNSLSEFAAPVAASESAAQTATITSTASTSTSPTKPYPGQVDGANTLWYGSYTSSGQIWFTQLGTSGLTSDYIYTCYAPAGATICSQQLSTPAPPAASPRNVQLDSTGAVWVSGQASGYVLQILGPGAPTWPQLSYNVPGTMPQ